MIFLRLLGPDLVAERDAEFVLAVPERGLVGKRPWPELLVPPVWSGSASGSAPARSRIRTRLRLSATACGAPSRARWARRRRSGRRRSDRSTSHRTAPRDRNRHRRVARRTDRAGVARWASSRASISCRPASICGAVTAFEPTNQTRSTMRAATCAANASCCSSLAWGARIRAMRPAERNLVDVPRPAVMEHPFVAPLVAEFLDQGRDEIGDRVGRDGSTGPDEAFRPGR